MTASATRPPAKSKSLAQKPSDLLLFLIATGLAVVTPYLTLHLKFRAFDLDPRLVEWQVIMSLPCVVILLLPIILLILSKIRRKNLSPKIRILIVLSPVLILSGPSWIDALIYPEIPEVPFAKRMGQPLPKDATGLKAWVSHAAGDSSYMFTFRCSANSTEALLATNHYELVENPPMLDPEISKFYQLPISGYTLPKGWPEPKTWNGLKVYSSGVAGGYRYLMTDEKRTQVFILVGDT